MKILSLVAILTLTTLNAFAAIGNDGPSGAPVKPKKPALLAEVVRSCGFCRFHDVKGVRIFTNGVVEKFTSNSQHPETKELLATLEPKAVDGLKLQVEAMPEEELVDQQQGQPECMDAPTTTYLVQKFVGTQVKIAQHMGCHEFTLQYDQGNSIRGLLQGFMDLSN